MLLRPRRRRAFTIIEILLVLAILGVLSGMAATSGGPPQKGKPYQHPVLERTYLAACAASRRTAETDMITVQLDTGGGAETADSLIKTAERIRKYCPESGSCYVDAGQIYCTQHIETPKFREQLGLE